MEELIAKLTALLGGDEAKAKEVAEKAKADGVTDLASAALLTESDLTGYGVPKIKARQFVADLVAANKPAPAPATATAVPTAMTALLPAVPDDGAFLALLQTGGVLKPQPADVMSAVRALYASRFRLFDIEDKLLGAIATRAEELEEQYPEIYYDVSKELARKAHSDVLQALGVPGKVFSEKAKNAFLGRVENIWSVLNGFQERIDAWQDSWQSKMSNPGVIFTSIAAMMGGGVAAAGATGLTDAPDTMPVVDAATGVIDAVNKVFAGPGIPVARALAADALQLRAILERPEIVSATGASTRDEMLKKLGLSVSADVVRSERALIQYVLGVLKLPEIPVNQLPMYIVALKEIGTNIPWGSLGGSSGRSPGNGGRSYATDAGKPKVF